MSKGPRNILFQILNLERKKVLLLFVICKIKLWVQFTFLSLIIDNPQLFNVQYFFVYVK